MFLYLLKFECLAIYCKRLARIRSGVTRSTGIRLNFGAIHVFSMMRLGA